MNHLNADIYSSFGMFVGRPDEDESSNCIFYIKLKSKTLPHFASHILQFYMDPILVRFLYRTLTTPCRNAKTANEANQQSLACIININSKIDKIVACSRYYPISHANDHGPSVA